MEIRPSTILSSLPPQWLLPLVLLLSAACYMIYQRLLHPLHSIPGPFAASLTRLWMVKHSWDGDMPTVMIKLHAQYGPLVRTGPDELSVADLSSIKTIYGAGTKFRKSDWYSVWQGRRKFDLFPERDEKVHGEQRRLVSRAYSMEALKDLEPYVDTAVTLFMEKMAGMEGQVVDMGTWVHLFAFDVIGELSFSKRFGFLEAGADDGTFEGVLDAMRCAAWIGQIPWLYWLHDFLSPYIGNRLAISARHGSVRQKALQAVTERRDRGSDHADILSKLFATHKEKPTQLDEAAITSMATSNIFAGADTTAISVRAIIYYLLRNPAAKRKFLSELDDARREGRLSDRVTLAEAGKLPYLQAVMYEALRLHPAVGMSLPRVVPAGGAQIAGTYVPAGMVVGANPWVVHQNREVYGDDVEAFRPERWMQEQRAGDMHRFFFAFGSGARMCLGRNISWMEMSKLIPTLFLHYDLELSEPSAEWEMKCWWLTPQTGLNVRLSRRGVS